MKIKVYTQLKPVFVQENEFKNDKGEVVKYYNAVCVAGSECDKISVRSEIAPDLNAQVGNDIFVWIDVDTNNKTKPKIIDLEKSKK